MVTLGSLRRLSEPLYTMFSTKNYVDKSFYRSRVPFISDDRLMFDCSVYRLLQSPLEDWDERARRYMYFKTTCCSRTENDIMDAVTSMVNELSYNEQSLIVINVTRTEFWEESIADAVSYLATKDFVKVDVPCEEETFVITQHKESDNFIVLTREYSTYSLDAIYTYVYTTRLDAVKEQLDSLVNEKPYSILLKLCELHTCNPMLGTTELTELVSWYKEVYVAQREKLKAAKALNDLSQATAIRTNNISTEIRRARSNIEYYTGEINELYAKIERLTATRLQTETKKEPFAALVKIMENLVNRGAVSNLSLTTDNGSAIDIKFSLKAPIIYWEEDEAAQWLNEFYDTRYKAFKAIFIDRKVRVHTQCAIRLGLYPGRGVDNGNIDFSREWEFIRHPHIAHYNCFGNNATSINEAVSNGEFDIAMNYVQNAASQLNMLDHTVVTSFISDLVDSGDYDNLKCVEELDTNTFITVGEFLNNLEGGKYDESNQDDTRDAAESDGADEAETGDTLI